MLGKRRATTWIHGTEKKSPEKNHTYMTNWSDKGIKQYNGDRIPFQLMVLYQLDMCEPNKNKNLESEPCTTYKN